VATLKEQVTELLDREAIRQLVNRYCKAVWDQDPDAFAALFAEHGVLAISGTGTSRAVEGRENLRAMIAESMENRPPGPLVHNHVVEIVDGSRAVGDAYVEVLGRSVQYARTATAHYRDQYVKVAGDWLFCRRDLSFFSASPAIASAYSEDLRHL
jgi:uncharacterized protein (TIGR02246 family)